MDNGHGGEHAIIWERSPAGPPRAFWMDAAAGHENCVCNMGCNLPSGLHTARRDGRGLALATPIEP